MNTVALLPMKAHSSRVKNKNFRTFAGKPLFQWILDTLTGLEEIDQVVINTDAREVLRAHGLEESDRVLIRDRKPELCGDEVSMNLVLADDVENISAESYLMTHTTNPLLSRATVRKALHRFHEGKKVGEGDSLFTVNRYQTRFYREEGEPVNHDPDNLIPTQDLEPWYEENSCLYLFSAESFSKTGARIGESPLFFETPALESVDIDTEVEWHHAEVLALSRLMFESHASFSE
ncbi:MAG: acylneuraminate cytidylyltransferase family protein [Verrucomicrobiales bacterium]|nr:acylneuraminate cytidylyltransferase family protein [Verrucomicrobiales bacterium]